MHSAIGRASAGKRPVRRRLSCVSVVVMRRSDPFFLAMQLLQGLKCAGHCLYSPKEWAKPNSTDANTRTIVIGDHNRLALPSIHALTPAKDEMQSLSINLNVLASGLVSYAQRTARRRPRASQAHNVHSTHDEVVILCSAIVNQVVGGDDCSRRAQALMNNLRPASDQMNEIADGARTSKRPAASFLSRRSTAHRPRGTVFECRPAALRHRAEV